MFDCHIPSSSLRSELPLTYVEPAVGEHRFGLALVTTFVKAISNSIVTCLGVEEGAVVLTLDVRKESYVAHDVASQKAKHCDPQLSLLARIQSRPGRAHP